MLNKEILHKSIGNNEDVSYNEYLKLNSLLDSQVPLSRKHDEMLFIIIHQSMELWFKSFLHELTAAMDLIQRDELNGALKIFSRIHKIQLHLVHSWDVLTTMTPTDFISFRDYLGRASGEQSYQYRLLEFTLGNKCKEKIKGSGVVASEYLTLELALHRPSLYDNCLKLLSTRGFDIPREYLQRDWSLPYQSSEQIELQWIEVYNRSKEYSDLFHLAEKLFEIDNQFQNWRFSHLRIVERMIGTKMGTGGSLGASYLLKSAGKRFFPELWTIRTKLHSYCPVSTVAV